MYGIADGFLGKEKLVEKYKYYEAKFPLIYSSEKYGQELALIDIISHYIGKDTTFSFAEIGVLAARTAVVLLEEFGERINYIGIDPLVGYSAGPELRMKEVREVAISRIKGRKNAVLIMKPSLEVVKTVMDETVDVVFIDGLHTYEATKLDAFFWYVKTRRILAFHDYGTYPSVKNAIDEFCHFLNLKLEHSFGDVAYIIK